MSTTTTPAAAPKTRLSSLDQFRGYTVVGMVFVNFVGAYVATPMILKHHNTYCSYADTIMPQFFFAVGFAFRLTFGRRASSEGLFSAYGHVVKRFLGLALVALIVEHVQARAQSWDQLVHMGWWEILETPVTKAWFASPLMHIAATSLWITPVIRASTGVRVAYMLVSIALQVVLSHWFYFDWVYYHGVDGGPLGFLTWSVPTIVGTLACDTVLSGAGWGRVARMLAWGAILMGIGWGLSALTTLYDVPDHRVAELQKQELAPDAVVPDGERWREWSWQWAEPPFVPPPHEDLRKRNYWMMSQRAATPTYHIFAAGFALALYALFYVVCDKWGWQLGLFRTLGSNALLAWIVHNLVGNAVDPFVPRDAPGWYVAAAFAVFFGIIYLVVHSMEKKGIYLKL